MGLKVVKCSDEAYAQICKVAALNLTYLADAVDLIVFRRVDSEGKRIKGGDIASPRKRARASKKRAPKAENPTGEVGKVFEDIEDLYED